MGFSDGLLEAGGAEVTAGKLSVSATDGGVLVATRKAPHTANAKQPTSGDKQLAGVLHVMRELSKDKEVRPLPLAASKPLEL